MLLTPTEDCISLSFATTAGHRGQHFSYVPTKDCKSPSLAKTLYSGNTCDKRDLSSLMTLGLSCLSLLTDWQISSTMGEIESRHNLFASQ
jgi:hypothetical protein